MALAPMGVGRNSGIAEFGRDVRKKVKGEKTLVTKKFPKWEEEAISSKQ
jgi:hypothetical protein